MMDFPSSPALDDLFISAGVVYRWNGYAWVLSTDNPFVLRAGDTMTGPLTLYGDPVDPLHAATKQYADTKQSLAQKGVANGYAGLDGSGHVPAAQLPAYVDDAQEYANLAAFPVTGMAGIIYVALDTGKIYRWSGSTYVEISPSPGSTDAVPEGAINKYYTDARASAAAPVQSVAGKTGAVTLVKGDVGLGNVDNTSDANKPVSTAQQTALNLKADLASPTFTGDPKAPTPATSDDDTSIATTAFVKAAMAASGALTDAPSDGFLYGRVNATWVRGAKLSGDTFTGFVSVKYSNPMFSVDKTASGESAIVRGALNGLGRWDLYLGDNAAEDGSNNGSDFRLRCRDNAGAALFDALYGKRATGLMTVKGDPTDLLGIVTKQYADTKAPLASPTFTGDPKAPTPSPGDSDTSIATTAFVAAALAALPTSAGIANACQGRISVVNATTIRLSRFQGSRVFINGAFYTIPSAGIDQSNGGLSANTTYSVFVFQSAGVIGANLYIEATNPVVDATYGVRVHPSNVNYLYLGRIRTNNSAQFQDTPQRRLIANEFNRRPIIATVVTAAQRTTTAGPWTELSTVDRIDYVLPEIQQVFLGVFSTVGNSVTGIVYASTALDGVTSSPAYCYAGTGWYSSMSAQSVVLAAEGYHYHAFVGGTSAGGTVSYEASYSGHFAMFMG